MIGSGSGRNFPILPAANETSREQFDEQSFSYVTLRQYLTLTVDMFLSLEFFSLKIFFRNFSGKNLEVFQDFVPLEN